MRSGIRDCPLLSSKYVHSKFYYIATPLPRVKALVVLDGSILLACDFVAEVAALRCEVRVLAQVLDSAEKEL
jgi:hypothetical protein